MQNKAVNKKHILITGASGYVGSYIANNLSKDFFHITTVSKSQKISANHIKLDLSEKKETCSLLKLSKSVDIIIHCAAIAHGQKPPNGFTVGSFNSLLLKNLVSVFKDKKIHWIFLSSISVYGIMHSNQRIPIIQRPDPLDSYGSGKLNDEQYLINNCNHLDILRLMPVYDKNNLDDIKKRVFIPGTNLKLLLQPSPTYSLCNIKEVLIAVNKCMQSKPGKRYCNVGDCKTLNQSEIANWFDGKVMHMPQFVFEFIFMALPKKSIFKNIAFMIKKFALNNTYEIESRLIK